MARSIGKVKIKKLETIVRECYAAGKKDHDTIIRDHVPAEWLDIWESAWSEVQRIVDDIGFKIARGE